MHRRRFLRALMGGTAALSTMPYWARAWTHRAPGVRSPHGTASLPPLTVGARTRSGAFVFDPVGLSLPPGESVVWLNMGDFHTATAFHPSYAELVAGDVPLRIPEGAEPFHSGMLGIDETVFEHRFQVPGVYDYFCQPHYGFGMVGRLVVGFPTDGPGTRPASDLPQAVCENLPPLETIVGAAGRAAQWAARINGVLLLRSRGETAAPSADAVREGLLSDPALGERLDASGARSDLAEKLRALPELAAEASYAGLIEHTDGIKEILLSAAIGLGPERWPESAR